MAPDKYTFCPDCGRKSVCFAARPNNEDGYYCRWASCGFYFFTSSAVSSDVKQRERWDKAQVLLQRYGETEC